MSHVDPMLRGVACALIASVLSALLVGPARSEDLQSTNVPAKTWKVQPEGSSLRFTGVSQGESFEGRFAEFDAMIRFDPAALPTSKFDVGITLASADSKNEERDSTLDSSDFFDVVQYPKARFVATEFVAVQDGFEALGALELRGVRKPVTLAFRWTLVNGGARLEGHTTLNRIDFGIGGGDWEDAEMIGHEVKVETTLILQLAKPL